MCKYGKVSQSRFFCTRCGKEGLPIQRKKGQERENGHLKKLYCIYCGEQINHVEIKDNGDYTYEDFLEEFNLGHFKEDGTRPDIKERRLCSFINCPYNKNNQCWDSNKNYDCGYKPNI